MQAVAPIVELAQKIDYKKRLPPIYVATGSYKLFVEEELEKGIEELTKAKTLSEETGDFLSLWFACYLLGFGHLLDCDPQKASNHYQMSLDLSKAAKNVVGICFAKSTDAAHTCPFSGKIDLAYKTCKESLDLAILSGDIYIQQMAYACYGGCCFFKGSFKEAETNLSKAINLHSRTGNVAWGFWAYWWLGELCFYMGDFEKAQHFYEQSNLILVDGKLFPSAANLINLKILGAKLLLKKESFHLESIVEYPKKNKIKLYAGNISNNICGILMNINSQYLSEAEKWIKSAIEANEIAGNIWWLAEDYAVYAKLLKRNGDNRGARQKLNRAIELRKKCSADGWVEKYEKDLAEL
jgi:tetratricopeptide (TPR) repeat protein